MDDSLGSGSLRPETIINDNNLLYLIGAEGSQFKHSTSENISNELTKTELERFENFVCFTKDAFLKCKLLLKIVKEQSEDTIAQQSAKLAKTLKTSFEEFHNNTNSFLKSYAASYDCVPEYTNSGTLHNKN